MLAMLLLPSTQDRAEAHEIQPSIATLSFGADSYRISITVNLEAIVAEIGPQHTNTSQSANASRYDSLRDLAPDDLRAAFNSFEERFLEGVILSADGTRLAPVIESVDIAEVGNVAVARETTLVLAGDLPRGARNFVWEWSERFGSSVILAGTVEEGNDFSAYLEGGQPSDAIGITERSPQSLWSVAANYVSVGYTHIVPKGLDHILFVVGLFLLSPRFRPLAFQITSFTIAHTITLALGSLGVIQVSPAIVEPIIAASIAYVAIENLFTDRMQRWRPFVVFGFGLLHGLGFAGVLSDIGLAPSQFLVGLLSFNVGVELGQLSVIAICFLTVGLFRHRAWYRPALTMPLSAAVATVGIFWFVQRVWAG